MSAFGLLTPNFEAEYRKRSNSPAISLVRKKCGRCGAVITAVQQKRSGKCVKCVVATAFVVARETSANGLPVNTTLPDSGKSTFATHQTEDKKA